MSLIKFVLTVLSMNVIFNRVTAQEKKQLGKLENKGKALMRAETAVLFNEKMCSESGKSSAEIGIQCGKLNLKMTE